ncbi:hypothetical protein Zmor_005608 [Zophobas morio]|uniref:Uncharacterized protein n=1 Tax=Zophobas morio TaxID=2755281 RepID=A0AA38IQ70_9CUCU|nr:hypothetical protein Zmor_005608 [Zophobas morio]
MKYFDATSLGELFGSVNSNDEIQALFFVGLCCLGAWVLFSWLIQILRSILWIWPLLLVIGLLLAVPSLRIPLTQRIIPKQVDGFMQIIDRRYNGYRNETLSQ